MKISVWKQLMTGILVAGITASCGSTRILADGKIDQKLTAGKIIRNHLAADVNFKTLNSRLGIEYSDGSSEQNVNVSLRMKRDEVIWLSAPLGVIKVYITPERVSFYNKLNNEFFEGDFSYLSNLLGSEIDFMKLQNLLLGQAIIDLKDRRYDIGYTANTYELKPRAPLELYKLFLAFEPTYFKMASQQMARPELKRLMEVRYTSYQKIQGEILPDQVHIAAIDQDERITIGITYKQVELNKDLRFPYKIPSGYNPIAFK